MINPITKAKEEMNLNEKGLALLAGVTEQTVRINETGDNLNITKKLLNFLIEQGYDEKKLIEDYSKFRSWRKEQLLQSMKKKRA